MSKLAVICAGIGAVVAMMFFSVMASIGGAIPGYFIGDFLAKNMHGGGFQRFLRWHLPGGKKKKKNKAIKLPSSDMKFFF
jgi:membrane protein YqaA with SNARE-associated domain